LIKATKPTAKTGLGEMVYGIAYSQIAGDFPFLGHRQAPLGDFGLVPQELGLVEVVKAQPGRQEDDPA
jgi:hypothetical protein